MSLLAVSLNFPTNIYRISARRRGKTVISFRAWIQNYLTDQTASRVGFFVSLPSYVACRSCSFVITVYE